jgi:hypothetical protein
MAGIDVPKRMLAVVVANARDRERQFEGRRFGSTISERQKLSTGLQERAVQEVGMESTAQYWKPVWFEQEGAGQLASWVGVCPGLPESAGESSGDRSAKGNRAMRRPLNQ